MIDACFFKGSNTSLQIIGRNASFSGNLENLRNVKKGSNIFFLSNYKQNAGKS